MATFWENVRERWDAAIAAAELGDSQPPVVVRKRRFWVRRPTEPIAITGMASAGKSVILDALVDQITTSYRPSGRSEAGENHRVTLQVGARKTRSWITVVPGQESDERRQAIDETLRGDHFPAGVVHVVSFGYAARWGADSQALLVKELEAKGEPVTFQDVRLRNLQDELDDFRSTCALLVDAWRHRPAWIVVAVAKCDLFWTNIEDACAYYLPKDVEPAAETGAGDAPDRAEDNPETPGTPPADAPARVEDESETPTTEDRINEQIEDLGRQFRATFRELVRRLGEDNLRHVTVTPISALPDTLQFANLDAIAPEAMSHTERAALISRLRWAVGGLP